MHAELERISSISTNTLLAEGDFDDTASGQFCLHFNQHPPRGG